MISYHQIPPVLLFLRLFAKSVDQHREHHCVVDSPTWPPPIYYVQRNSPLHVRSGPSFPSAFLAAISNELWAETAYKQRLSPFLISLAIRPSRPVACRYDCHSSNTPVVFAGNSYPNSQSVSGMRPRGQTGGNALVFFLPFPNLIHSYLQHTSDFSTRGAMVPRLCHCECLFDLWDSAPFTSSSQATEALKATPLMPASAFADPRTLASQSQ